MRFCEVPVATGQELLIEQFPYGQGSCTGSVFERRFAVGACTMNSDASRNDTSVKVECRDGKLVSLQYAGTTCTGVAEKQEWGAAEGDCFQGMKVISHPCTTTTSTTTPTTASTPTSTSQGGVSVPVAGGQELVYEQFPDGQGSCTGSVFEHRFTVDACTMISDVSGNDASAKVECRDGKLVLLQYAGTTCTGGAEKQEWGAAEGDCFTVGESGMKITSHPCTATTTLAQDGAVSASACLTFSGAFFIANILYILNLS